MNFIDQYTQSRANVRGYNLLIGAIKRFLWKCPVRVELEQYNRYVAESTSHLVIGCASVALPVQSRLSRDATVTLLDIHEPPLVAAEAQLRRSGFQQINTIQADLLDPDLSGIDVIPGFDSIAMHYVLHCIKGPMAHKLTRIIDHLVPWMDPKCVLFGSTLCNLESEYGWLTKRWFRKLQGTVFFNEADFETDISSTLEQWFDFTCVHRVGHVTLLEAAQLRRTEE